MSDLGRPVWWDHLGGHHHAGPACAAPVPGWATLSVCPTTPSAKTPWVSRNRYIFRLPELKRRVCWTWARAGRAAGPQGGQNKALRGPGNGDSSSLATSPFLSGVTWFLISTSPWYPFSLLSLHSSFLPLRAHHDNGHASPLFYAVLVLGPIVTDQKARVPIADAPVVSTWVRSMYSQQPVSTCSDSDSWGPCL